MKKTIKASDIWQNIGNTILIKNDNEIPDGYYSIVDSVDYGIVLFKHDKDYLLCEYEDDDEFEIILESSKDKIKTLIDYQIYQIIMLTRDGWTLNGEMNIESDIERLQNYVLVGNILNEN